MASASLVASGKVSCSMMAAVRMHTTGPHTNSTRAALPACGSGRPAAQMNTSQAVAEAAAQQEAPNAPHDQHRNHVQQRTSPELIRDFMAMAFQPVGPQHDKGGEIPSHRCEPGDVAERSQDGKLMTALTAADFDRQIVGVLKNLTHFLECVKWLRDRFAALARFRFSNEPVHDSAGMGRHRNRHVVHAGPGARRCRHERDGQIADDRQIGRHRERRGLRAVWNISQKKPAGRLDPNLLTLESQ